MKPTADELLKKYLKDEAPHAYEVQRLCELLFLTLNENVKEMSPRELEILKAAALLHDIGYAIEEKSHNKHSQEIILKEGLSEFSEEEIKMTACIARYHRGGLPDKNNHELYGNFAKPQRKIIKRLAGILRFADGLDLEHRKVIQAIKAEYDSVNNILKLILIPYKDEKGLNISKSLRKRDLLELGFKCQSVVFIKTK